MKVFNKLVRDKIPEIIRKNGDEPVCRVLDEDSSYRAALFAKLDEEAAELRGDPCLNEVADVVEVAFAIAKLLGASEAEVLATAAAKRAKNGGFDDRVFLVSTKPIKK